MNSLQRRTQSERDPNISIRQGVLFQEGGCPQAIPWKEAEVRLEDKTPRSNIIRLTEQSRGRTGNRYENMSQYLSMGYCCRSNLLELPSHDEEMPVPSGTTFMPTRRWFDFSEADIMPLLEFEELSKRPEVCKPYVEVGGKTSFRLYGVHPDLLSCMNRVYLRGCEAEYLGPTAKMSSACEPSSPSTPFLETSPFTTTTLAEERTVCENNVVLAKGPRGDTNGGTLAVHIRSGDIFRRKKRGSSAMIKAGQPPLQFYLKAIKSRQWFEVSIITYASSNGLLNPTYTALEAMNQQGQLGPNVNFLKNRDLLDDLRTMSCADGVVMSRSSLHFMTTVLTRASTFYMPSECGPGRYNRASKRAPHSKVAQENTTLLLLEKPDAEVYGIQWQLDRESYSPYTAWNNTQAQVLEMIKFEDFDLKECCL
ncbi:unnamed protein product [Ascophyllum nodosum]